MAAGWRSSVYLRLAYLMPGLAINYYTTSLVQAGAANRFTDTRNPGAGDIEEVPSGAPTTARGWEVDPEGLYDVLRRVSREYDAPPLWITENGAAYDDEVSADGHVHDQQRIAFLDAHLRAALRAIKDGVDLRGYFIWTLMDNFEWSFGESSRFGLIHVDFETQIRTPKDSAAWLACVISANALPTTDDVPGTPNPVPAAVDQA